MSKLVVVLGGVGLFFATAACSPNTFVESSGERSTRQAQETARVETAVFVGTQAGTLVAIQSTVDSASIMGTQLAQLQQEGLYLQTTIDAITTLGVPAQPIFTPTFVSTPEPLVGTTTLGNVPRADYTDIRTATDVDTNGCPVDKRGRFSETVNRVYLTTLAFGVRSGTSHQVRWFFGDELRSQSPEWVADQDYAEICVYFWLSSSDTPFEAGIWQVDLLIDGEIYREIPFEFCVAGELC